MPKLRKFDGNKYRFFCPGCGCYHYFEEGRWAWNGDLDKPTATPSIVVPRYDANDNKITACHLFMTNGTLRYLPDCIHDLAGKTVDMEEED